MPKIKLLAALLCTACASAYAAPTMQCQPPSLTHYSDDGVARIGYATECKSAARNIKAPTVRFTGDLNSDAGAPYKIQADYEISVLSDHATRLSSDPLAGQVVRGGLRASAASPATLPAQLVSQMTWDDQSGVLSINEVPGRWHAFAVLSGEDGLVQLIDAGYASEAVQHGKARLKVSLGTTQSRFAGKTPVTLTAQLQLREGRLELLMGETQASAQFEVQNALLNLDKGPKDLTRAWALAARAQYLGLDAEVQYAVKKVAAHNPQFLLEFQKAVEGIKPFSLMLP